MSVAQADISAKDVIFRQATASGRIKLKRSTLERVRRGTVEKGDAAAIAKVMAVLAAKDTPRMLALCHPLQIERTEVEVKVLEDTIEASATVSAHEKTGVEMEALTAVSIALLNIWDVLKPYEKDSRGQYPGTSIQDIHVVEKIKR